MFGKQAELFFFFFTFLLSRNCLFVFNLIKKKKVGVKGWDGKAEGKLAFVGLGNRIAIPVEAAEPERSTF